MSLDFCILSYLRFMLNTNQALQKVKNQLLLLNYIKSPETSW